MDTLSPPAGSISRTDVEQDIPDLLLGANGNPADASPSGGGVVNGTTSSRRKTTNLSRVREKMQFIQDFQAFLKPELGAYCRAVLYIMVPATGIAFILFYLADNPPTGMLHYVYYPSPSLTSYSCPHRGQGLLFILLRRPYDIGDRIHISDVNNETVASGSPTWFVRDIFSICHIFYIMHDSISKLTGPEWHSTTITPVPVPSSLKISMDAITSG